MPDGQIEKAPWNIRTTFRVALVAAFIHFACFVYTYLDWRDNGSDRAAVYELYRPAFVVDSNLTTSVQTQLRQSCPRADLRVRIMQATFDKKVARGMWVAVDTTLFGFVHINGYDLLMFIFAVSCVAQLNVAWEFHKGLAKKDFSFFHTPCAARWLEYAFTSPCMIVLVAACLSIRDLNTILLLSAAQGALVQFGFAMECAYSLRVLEGDEEVDMNAPVEFRPLPLIPYLRTFPKISQQLWYWSFMPSTLLHALVWGVLISNFDYASKTKCFDEQPVAPWWIQLILVGQGLFFTSFMFVAIWQAWTLDVIPLRKQRTVHEEHVRESFATAFLGYTVLSAGAKAFLGITYVSYVKGFPFATPL